MVLHTKNSLTLILKRAILDIKALAAKELEEKKLTKHFQQGS